MILNKVIELLPPSVKSFILKLIEKRNDKLRRYLETRLRYHLSIDYVSNETKNEEMPSKHPFDIKTVLLFPIIILNLFLFIVIFLPLTIIINLVLWLRAIISRVSFEPILPLPAGCVELIKGNIRIEIRPNDHMPPHFHVRYNEYDCSFEIETCELLAGRLPKNTMVKQVQRWHEENKMKLIEYWNKTRPSKKGGK